MGCSKRKIPLRLFALDFVGAIFVALGFLDLVDDGGLDGIACLIVGLLLMTPLIGHILGSLPEKRVNQTSDGEK